MGEPEATGTGKHLFYKKSVKGRKKIHLPTQLCATITPRRGGKNFSHWRTRWGNQGTASRAIWAVRERSRRGNSQGGIRNGAKEEEGKGVQGSHSVKKEIGKRKVILLEREKSPCGKKGGS